MKILVIGNKGSFFDESCKYLANFFEIISLMSNNAIRYKEDNESNISNELKSILNNHIDLKAIVYIGGEVRLKEKMIIENYHKPLVLAKLALDRNIKFLYLSSLSVYDNVCERNHTKISKNTKELTNSEYGKSKLKLDKKIAILRKKGLKSFTIRPASIVGSSRMNSSIEKIAITAFKYPQLKYFYFSGYISFITRHDILLIIKHCLKSQVDFGVILAAKNINISNVIWSINGKPFFYLPVSLVIKLFSFFNIAFFRNLANQNVYNMDYFESFIEPKEKTLKLIIQNTAERLYG